MTSNAPPRHKADSPLTKGERTRRRLLDAALQVLARDGYHDLKITSVTREAGVANGVFYIYFADKPSIALSLMDEIITESLDQVFVATERPADAFEALLAANRAYVRRFVDGGGLNRAVAQIVDALPEARVKWQAANAQVASRIAAGIARRAPDAAPHGEARLFAALALQAMLDTVLLQAFAYEASELSTLRRHPERLAQALSILWQRALFGVDPKPAQVPDAQDFLTFRAGGAAR